MSDNKYTAFLEKYRDKMTANKPLSDLEMKDAKGGVGGANEATCPQCGKPMTTNSNPYGDDSWYCSACQISQICSDAETIEIIRAMEQAGYSSEIVYPVWWKQINH